MNKRSFGKLQLNRETLRDLTTGELQQVVGGVGTQLDGCTDGCGGNSNASDCRFACPQTASCECDGGTWPWATWSNAGCP